MVELISECEVFVCFRIALDEISKHMVAEPKNEDTIKTLKALVWEGNSWRLYIEAASHFQTQVFMASVDILM